MASLRRNTIANYIGRGWIGLMGLAFLPLYAAVLGPESYGLIGAFSILQAWALLFDFGLTPTLNREMARSLGDAHTPTSIHELLRTFEVTIASIAVLVAISIAIASPWLAKNWLQPRTISVEVVAAATALMGLAIALRWMEQVYRAALQGLHDQLWLNGAQIILETVRWGGAYIVVRFLVSTVIGFFAWQAVVSLLSIPIWAWRTSTRLPPNAKPVRFRFAHLKNVRAFATGMFWSSLLTFGLTQIDKVVVAKSLPLSDFGFYMLAAMAANGLLQLITPMTTAIFPRLAAQVAQGHSDEAGRTMVLAAQLLAVVLVPFAAVMIVMPESVMLLWTDNPVTTANTRLLLAVLASATLANGFMNMPYMLQLAHGWTSLSIITNTIAIAIVVPGVLVSIPRYGSVGAAVFFLALNIGYILFVAPILFRRLAPSLLLPWYVRAVLLPLVGGVLPVLLVRAAMPPPTTRFEAGIIVVITGALAALGSISVTAPARHRLIALVRQTVSRWRIRTRDQTEAS